MDKETFVERKAKLINLIKEGLAEKNISEKNEISFNKLLEILSQYSFENGHQMKGLLAHTIIDSLELEYSIGEKFIKFDNDISKP